MKIYGILLKVILLILCSMILLPVITLFTASFMPMDELMYRYMEVLGGGNAPVRIAMIPSYPTLDSYVELFLYSPGFFVMFWNSCFQVFPMLAGQLLVAVPAAWSFAKYPTRLKKKLYSLYIILMILPFQITMVSNYLVLDYLNILNTHLAIVLPGIWSTFPVFILTKFFEGIPQSLIEAAYLDGANELYVLSKIAIPLGKPGIVTASMLGFFDAWSALEQPLAYLNTQSLWPLSLYLPNINADKPEVAFAASVVVIISSILIFLNGQEFLEQGIMSVGIKE